jgi:hypothetical protein
MDLSTLLAEYPENEPLPNIAAFDTLKVDGDPEQIHRLNLWVESQQFCDYVRRWHGDAGLSRVLKGIAEACAAKGVTMGPRVRAVAGWWEIPPV